MSESAKEFINLYRFFDRNVLDLACAPEEVVRIIVDDQELSASDKMLAEDGDSVLWELPAVLPNFVQIDLDRPGIGFRHHLLTSRDLMDRVSLVRFQIDVRSSEISPTLPGDNWGVAVHLGLSFDQPFDETLGSEILRKIMSSTLEISRRDKIILRRPLYALTSLVQAAVAQVFVTSVSAQQDLSEGQPHVGIQRQALLERMRRSEQQLEFLSPLGVADFLDAIEAERRDAGTHLVALKSVLGQSAYDRALAYWREAVPGLVSARLTLDQVEQAGLLHLMAGRGDLDLGTVYLVDGDQISFVGVEQDVFTEIALDSKGVRPAQYGGMRVQDDRLEWDAIGARRSALDLQGLLHLRSGKPVSSEADATDALVVRHGIVPTDGLRDFVAELLGYAPVPNWFSKGCHVSQAGVESDPTVAPLMSAQVGMDPALPQQIAGRFLARWIVLAGVASDCEVLNQVVQMIEGTPEWTSLRGLDDQLHRDSRYQNALHLRISQLRRTDETPLNLSFEDGKNGRMAALVTLMLSSQDNWQPFQVALQAQAIPQAVSLVQTLLGFENGPRAVQ